MRFTLSIFLISFTFLVCGQKDTVLVYYPDSTVKVKQFSDGSRESYYADGSLLSRTSGDLEKCRLEKTAYQTDLYRSGRVMTRWFPLPNGKFALEGYEDSSAVVVSGGRRDNNRSTFVYKGNIITEIRSEPKKKHEDEPVLFSPNNHKYENRNTIKGSCIEKGNFRHFELYSGFIYYYDSQGERELTEKVVDGVIQGNPRVHFNEAQLNFIATLYFDRNYNGYAEQREIDAVDRFKLTLADSTFQKFDWSEVYKFPNLTAFFVNGYLYNLSDYEDVVALTDAIKTHKGQPIGLEFKIEPQEHEQITQPKIVEFPETEASFPGGENALKKWIDEELRYPEIAIDEGIQGKVFFTFIVLADGSLTDIKIAHSFDPKLNKEAQRIMETMPKWIPAMDKGKAVASKGRCFIVFRLD